MENMLQNRVPVPSILYTDEQARALSCENIQGIAKNGLNKLRERDPRFHNFSRGKDREENAELRFGGDTSDLFSSKSVIDRGSLSRPQTDWIRDSVASYLRLITNYLESRDALDTLEYLIRIYSIHKYNWKDLVLCALPHYEEPAFVRIVQLLPISNTRWEFLGVVNRFTAFTREIFIKQCNEDMQILEELCAYVLATQTKMYPPSQVVFEFTMSIVIGLVAKRTTFDDELFKKIHPVLDNSLQSGMRKRLDHKASGLIIVGMLAQTAKLDCDYFINSIVLIAEQHAKDSTDLWRRLSFMALINYVQLQQITDIPKKPLHRLSKLRDISGLLLRLSREFNMNEFLEVLLGSFIRSSSDAQCCKALLSIIDTIPMGDHLVYHLVSGVFSEAVERRGSWCTQILYALNQKCSAQLKAVVHRYLLNTGLYESKEQILRIVMDFWDTSMWLQSDISMQERRMVFLNLVSDDLYVLHATLSLEHFPRMLCLDHKLLDGLLHVVQWCSGKKYREIFQSGESRDVQLVVEVLALSLKFAVSIFPYPADASYKVTSALLLIQPEVVNLFKDVSIHHFDLVIRKRLCSGLEDLFFFLTTTQSHDVFKKHLHYRREEARVCPILFQSQLIAREDVDPLVRIESLCFFLQVCPNVEWSNKILSRFPTLLVPLLSDNEELKGAASDFIQRLVDVRGDRAHVNDEFLRKLVQEKELLSSQYLPKYFNSTYDSIEKLEQRFYEFAKQQNLLSIFRLEKVGDLVSRKKSTKRTRSESDE